MSIEPPPQPLRKNSIDAPFANLSYFCRAHAEECHYWCHTCARPCCDSCITSPDHHSNHDTQRRKTLDESKNNLSSDLATQKKREIQSAKEQIVTNREVLSKKIKEAKEQIMEKITQFMKTLNEEQTRLFDELDSIEKSTIEQYKLDEAKLAELGQKLETCDFDDQIPSSQIPEINLAFGDQFTNLGSIKTSIVASKTVAYGPGLESITTPTHPDDWAEFTIYPRGWLNETIDEFTPKDFTITVIPEPSCISFERGIAYYTVKYMPKVRADHQVEITYKMDPLGKWVARHREKRDYHGDLERRSVGQNGSDRGQFKRPWGICALPDSQVAITDRANNRIQIINKMGDVSMVYPEDDSTVFNRPAGIAFSAKPTPTLIIADKDNHQIQVSFRLVLIMLWVYLSLLDFPLLNQYPLGQTQIRIKRRITGSI